MIDQRSCVLLVWRCQLTDVWGWEAPGGRARASETGPEAAARRAIEETGWEPIGLKQLIVFQSTSGGRDALHKVYVARRSVMVDHPPKPVDPSVVQWIPMADIPALIREHEILGAGSLVGIVALLMGIGLEDSGTGLLKDGGLLGHQVRMW
ncbi:NUDIX hydrolase [Mycobacteroides sp. PCS013]|uniref:NUDIX hydrolase n=1 Tax=Mycobacteroides sp. PCS013 TaxID=3074106 RepID=UPI003C2C000B